MKVKEYLEERLSAEPLHMTLIDPDNQSPEGAGTIAQDVDMLGTDAIMVGGSTGITQENLDETVLSIKKRTELPVIYFPSGAHAISGHCDAVYFMSMLNSRNIDHVIGEQVTGATAIRRLGLETISMGYLIVEPGMKVGEVGQADVLKRDDIEKAIAYGLATELFGMDLVYLEAGSGAPEPVSCPMIRAMKEALSIPLVVGGGIRKPEQASEIVGAGADIIVTGNVVEDNNSNMLRRIIEAIKS